ncbi:peptidase associated/transthyretin-like domain-containing protein [Henriciella aquimarina]|uniref:hypothetical protein n=1 Tax=Henriciella aquimarina TaxID=545261 RepID=UPI000A00D173|nr:hypothetical protein [Henriciella aquimarina]
MRALTAGVLASALALTPACEARPKTLFPHTQGTVFLLESGAPVEGARVTTKTGTASTATDKDGRFEIAAEIGKDRSIPLPASGVYRDSALLAAHHEGHHAFAPVDFISISEEAESETWLFLLPADAPYSTEGLPADCALPEPAVYGLQLLAAGDTASLQTVLAANPDFAFAFNRWLDRTLVRQLPQTCEIATQQLLDWMDTIETLTAPASD